MYEPSLFQNGQGVKELGRKDLDKLRAEALELILLDQLVQVRRQQFEDKAQMIAMNKGIS
jgi:hypothetical protein